MNTFIVLLGGLLCLPGFASHAEEKSDTPVETGKAIIRPKESPTSVRVDPKIFAKAAMECNDAWENMTANLRKKLYGIASPDYSRSMTTPVGANGAFVLSDPNPLYYVSANGVSTYPRTPQRFDGKKREMVRRGSTGNDYYYSLPDDNSHFVTSHDQRTSTGSSVPNAVVRDYNEANAEKFKTKGAQFVSPGPSDPNNDDAAVEAVRRLYYDRFKILLGLLSMEETSNVWEGKEKPELKTLISKFVTVCGETSNAPDETKNKILEKLKSF